LPAITETIRHDNLDGMISLYKRGLFINSDIAYGDSGLHLASRFGALQCTIWLLQNKADPFLENKSGQSAFELAAANDCCQQLQALIEYTGVDVNQIFSKGGQSLLHRAAHAGRLKHLMFLMMEGCSLDIADTNGFTPLHLAAKKGHVEAILLLLACGANPSLLSINDKTPLDLVDPKDQGTRSAFAIFNEVNRAGHKGESSLHLAVRMNHIPAVILLSNMEDIDHQDDRGLTALHLAVEAGQKEIVLYLLKAGADPDKVDSMGISPRMIAHRSRYFHKDILKILDSV
jgi:ankyrin repeat protein